MRWLFFAVLITKFRAPLWQDDGLDDDDSDDGGGADASASLEEQPSDDLERAEIQRAPSQGSSKHGRGEVSTTTDKDALKREIEAATASRMAQVTNLLHTTPAIRLVHCSCVDSLSHWGKSCDTYIGVR